MNFSFGDLHLSAFLSVYVFCCLMAPPVNCLTEEGNVSTKMTISVWGFRCLIACRNFTAQMCLIPYKIETL